MARLIYSAIASLDGYVEDEDGRFDWARPDEEVHAFVNDLERPVGTYLYGRRMYETMAYWETGAGESAVTRDFDPEAVRELKAQVSQDLAVGGAGLAAAALRAGLVDELNLVLSPVLVGGGKRALPDGVRLDLELLDERRFGNGVVDLHYRVG